MPGPIPDHGAPFILLAPMEGVLDPVLRSILCSIGGIDQAVTEFIRVTSTLLPAHVFYRYCPELLDDGVTSNDVPVFVQLLGSQLDTMAENAAQAASLGAPGIDLNFGCPAKTVNRHDGGSVLLKDPERVFKIIEAVRKAVPSEIPVTAKVRLGFETKDLCEEIAQAVQAAGASWITVHARTKTDGYNPPAYWEFIPRMKQHLTIPVIANGEVWTVDDWKRGCTMSGIDSHWALGRGIVSRPDLGLQIKRAYAEKVPGTELISWDQMLPHIFLFIEKSLAKKCDNPNAFALARLKQWFRYLSRGYKEAQELFEVIKRCDSLAPAIEALKNSLETMANIKTFSGSSVSRAGAGRESSMAQPIS